MSGKGLTPVAEKILGVHLTLQNFVFKSKFRRFHFVIGTLFKHHVGDFHLKKIEPTQTGCLLGCMYHGKYAWVEALTHRKVTEKCFRLHIQNFLTEIRTRIDEASSVFVANNVMLLVVEQSVWMIIVTQSASSVLLRPYRVRTKKLKPACAYAERAAQD